VTNHTFAAGDDASRAEVLLWQSGYRIGIATAIVAVGLLLRLLGLVSSQSLLAPQVGPDGAAVAFTATTALYVLLVVAVRWHLRATHAASSEFVWLVLVTDVVALYVGALFMTPPRQFDRMLIMSMFFVQITQLYFGWRTTLFQLGVVGACYGTIVVLANRAGLLSLPIEQLYTFSVFCVGTLAYAGILGHQGNRMRRLTRLFDRAREGDFDQPYDDTRDRFPDHITEIGRAYNKLRGHLEFIILTDPLSGCFNRRGFDQMASREVSRGIRAKWHVSMLAMDVDHFKNINDEFGHLTGDEAIREIGAVLRETARAGDVVARIGGEEFSILAPETDEAGAVRLADRILDAFRTRAFASLRGRMSITISIGLASEEAVTDEVVRTLTARSDEALYVAKHNGRDQAVLWQTGMRAFDPAKRTTREIERLG
jgi:diguanylate cyclase (GGDEF)-like protein